MRKTRGFRLRTKLVKIFRWASGPRNPNPISKLLAMARRSLQHGAKALASPRAGYIRMGRVDPTPLKAPKGHLAVYVGETEDDTQRHLVPVIYFNHPMFGKLLKKTEKVYGFDYPGRITIPVGVSEFERVKNSIAAAECGRRRRRRRFDGESG